MRTTERKVMRFWWKEKTEFDDSITTLLERMRNADPLSDEYLKLLQSVERFNALKTSQRRQKLSRDTIAMVMGNLAGILIIVAYERENVLSSKSFTQLIRPK